MSFEEKEHKNVSVQKVSQWQTVYAESFKCLCGAQALASNFQLLRKMATTISHVVETIQPIAGHLGPIVGQALGIISNIVSMVTITIVNKRKCEILRQRIVGLEYPLRGKV